MSKFNTILENFIGRGMNDGFSIGDIVKFNKDYQTHDFYKHASKEIKQHIDDLAASEKNIKVINIRPELTVAGNSVVNNNSRGHGVIIDIALEYAPYRTDNGRSISVPANMLEIVWSDFPNTNKQPSEFDKKFEEYTKKFDGVDKKYFRRQAEVQNKLQDINDTLPSKNIEISNSKNGKVDTNIVSDNTHYSETPLMESYLSELLDK